MGATERGQPHPKTYRIEGPHQNSARVWSPAVLRLSQNSFSHPHKTPPESSKRAITQMGAKNFRVERFLKLLRQSLLCRFGFRTKRKLWIATNDLCKNPRVSTTTGGARN